MNICKELFLSSRQSQNMFHNIVGRIHTKYIVKNHGGNSLMCRHDLFILIKERVLHEMHTRMVYSMCAYCYIVSYVRVKSLEFWKTN